MPVNGGTFPIVNPATEEVVHHAPIGTADDVDLAVKAARRAFDHGPWPRMSGVERARYLRAIATGIRNRLQELALLETIDNGKPIPEAEWDIGDAAGCFDFYADLAEELDRKSEEAIPIADTRFTSKAVREPVGVAAAIIPWNYPLLMAAWKVAPALAAGCTMVLKPAELTSMTAMELAAIVKAADLPPGVLNVVTGVGSVAGQALADHPNVDKLAFTGSVPVGSKVMQAAARDIKRVSLELGGKSPFIVFEELRSRRCCRMGHVWHLLEPRRGLLSDIAGSAPRRHLRPLPELARRGNEEDQDRRWPGARCFARSTRVSPPNGPSPLINRQGKIRRSESRDGRPPTRWLQ